MTRPGPDANPRTAKQLLGQLGMTEAEFKQRVAWLAKARQGDEAARRALMARYGCKVVQREFFPR